jgi:hypothetical protein
LKKALLFLIFLLLFSFRGYSQTEGLGVGMVFGEPCGLDAKRWIDAKNAFEFAIGFSPALKNSRLTLHLDYLWHDLEIIHSHERFAMHYGIGLRYSARKDESAIQGIRFIDGLMWYPVNRIPFEFYVEVAPVVVVYPYFGMTLDAGAGFRYYFTTNY